MNPPFSHLLEINCPSPEHTLELDWAGAESLQLFVKRDDLIHPIISGNKWRKLAPVVEQVMHARPSKIISFGGGFSNHLHALGYVCAQLDIAFHAIVRGDYGKQLTPMLRDLHNWQCQVEYVNKITYQKRGQQDYLQALTAQHPGALIIPEGGSQVAALSGIAALCQEFIQEYDYILAPVASGATLAGLIEAQVQQLHSAKVIGIAMLKGEGYLEELVLGLLSPSTLKNAHWQILHTFHHGGYAKAPDSLKHFCQSFTQHTQIPVEPVYSGKLFWALQQLLKQQFFPPKSRILLLHTGGLQGAR